MERQIEQLVTLVDDLLDISRITRGKLELRKFQIDLQNVIDLAIETSRPLIDEGEHELEVTLPDEPIELYADPHRLAQVLSNLLNNSAKYTPDRGHIRLTAQRQGNELMLSVKDDGIGIPSDRLGSIFELFDQVDAGTQRVRSGLGIGLTLVKSLVEMHGGSIEVRSEGLGQGSEFLVRLPILSAPAGEPQRVDRAGQPAPVAPRRVLIVDDNEDAAKLLAQVIALQGHETRTAGDGQQAIDVAAEFGPDLILMDIGMPRMDGCEAARQMRRHEWGRNMTIVALSGWGTREDKRKSKEAGFDEHLVKPPDPADLDRILTTPRPPG